MAEVTLGLDLGTSGVKVVALGPDGQTLAQTTHVYPLLTPQPGWTEQRPADWAAATVAALREVAGQLRAADTLARMGGDEFVVVLPDLATANGAVAVAAKLVACLAEPLRVGERALAVTSSVGVAVYPDDGPDGGSLQRHADEQMYLAKRRGRNGYAAAARPAAR